MIKHLSMAFLFIACTQSVYSADLFGISISSPNTTNPEFDTYNGNFTNIDDLFNATEQTNIASQITGYDQHSAANIEITMGESSANLIYLADDSNLAFRMPGCSAIDKDFSNPSGSRTINENSFREYINRQDISNKINSCLSKTNGNVVVMFPTETDSVPGSNGGLFNPRNTGKGDQEKFGVGLVVGYSSTGKLNSSVLTLPISYTHYYEEEGRKLKISAPISYIDVNGSKAYKASLGLIYTRPMNERWTVIPAARLGITVSRDMGVAATLASAYVTNRYEFPYRNKHITLANMVGVMTTLDVNLGGYKNSYDLSNQVVKNGIAVEFPQTFNMFGGKTSIQASLANTQYFGDKMRVDNYTDIAVSFGTRRKVGNKDNSQDNLQLGFTYTVGNHGYKGGKLNFGYEF